MVLLMQPDIHTELHRTHPDRIVYSPGTLEAGTGKTGNEQLLVTALSDRVLIAVWTQSTREGQPDHHIVFSRSEDEGHNWSEPVTLAGPDRDNGVGMASWGFPVVSKSGVIYVFYSQHHGLDDFSARPQNEATLRAIRSSDGGRSWSQPGHIEMPPSIYDDTTPDTYPVWVVWQKPERLSRGKYFVGQTRWVRNHQWQKRGVGSVTEFIRFENIDDDPEVADLRLTWLCQNEQALRYGRHLEEPSIVKLPDGRLFCVLRTTAGHACFTVSEDEGDTWSNPLALRHKDNGTILPHPHSPCPIYSVGEGQYAFLYHGHSGDVPGCHTAFPGGTAVKGDATRRPSCIARGEFKPDALQPIWFSDPWVWMDTAGVPMLRAGMSFYSSATPTDAGILLWYPDRKYFLLGREVTRPMLAPLPAAFD